MVKTVGSGVTPLSLTVGGPTEFKAAWSPDSQTIYYAKQIAAPPNSNLDIMKRPSTGGTEVPVANATGVDEYQPVDLAGRLEDLLHAPDDDGQPGVRRDLHGLAAEPHRAHEPLRRQHQGRHQLHLVARRQPDRLRQRRLQPGPRW